MTNIGAPRAFLKAVINSNTDKCIPWPYCKSKGYGTLRFAGKMRTVSRIVCRVVNGRQSAEKPLACHDPITCNNPSCVNPKHLRWASYKQNQKDKNLALRHANDAKAIELLKAL